jgi:hypothetical protein
VSNKLVALAIAIGQREGFGIEGDIPTRLNNPGDLLYARQVNAAPHAVTGLDGKVRVYASFKTLADGWAALYAQIRLDAGRGKTLAEFIDKYAPGSDGNDPASYLAFVMRQISCQNASAKLAELIA